MSDSKISQLPQVNLPLTGTELFAVVQGTAPNNLATYQIALSQLQTGISTGISQLPQATLPLSGSELLTISQNNGSGLATYQISFSQLQSGISNDLLALPTGGTTNQVLFKISNTNGNAG